MFSGGGSMSSGGGSMSSGAGEKKRAPPARAVYNDARDGMVVSDKNFRGKARACLRGALAEYRALLGSEQARDLHRLVLSVAEEEAVRAALEWTRGNRSEAARALGISRTTLARKIREFPSVADDFDSPRARQRLR